VDGLDVGVGAEVGVGVAAALGDVDGVVVAEAGVEGEAAGVAVPQPAIRPAAPARAAMAMRIRADVISLPPPVVAKVVTLGMTPFGARWLRPAPRAAYHGIDTMPNNLRRRMCPRRSRPGRN
jgi:hypothetical protein